MANKTDYYLTPTEVCKEIHDYLSFLEEGGGPEKNSKELHSWLTDMIFSRLTLKDSIVDKVTSAYQKRSEEGIKKYGTTLQDNHGDFKYWLTHLQEELMDATLYLEKLKQIGDED